MQVVTAFAPSTPVELAEHGQQDLRTVGSRDPLLLAPHRQLPADVRLVFQRVYAIAQRLPVQRAPAAAREVRVVQEDARTVRPDRSTQRRRRTVDRVRFGVVLEAAPEVLPRVRGQSPSRRADAFLVVLIGEERAVRAASVAGPAGHDAVAATREDARPPGQQPRDIGTDHVLRIGRIAELDVFARKVERHFAIARVVVDIHHRRNRVVRPRALASAGARCTHLASVRRVTSHRCTPRLDTVCVMRLAVLDVGSNTVHLLVVDAHLGAHPWPAHSVKAVLRLAEQIGKDGRLSKAGADALVTSVGQARDAAVELETEDLLAFGTSAVRDARNSAEVLARVRKETGVDLRVLSGEGEARMTFLAVRRWYGWSAGRLLVLDIGGGSLEIGLGIDEEPDVALSLPIGAGRLTRERLHGDPPSAVAIRALTEYVEATLDAALRNVDLGE